MRSVPSIAVVLSALTLAASSAHAQWWWPPTGGMSVDPTCPHPTSPLTLQFSGQWPDSCIPNLARADVVGNVVNVRIIVDPPPGFCLTVITPWSMDVPLDPLPAGRYDVFAAYYEGQTQVFPPAFVGTITIDSSCPSACYPDCDGSGTLDIFDFLCFQNSFVLGEPYACDCDPDPACDIFDFLCFQNAFVSGCP